MVRVFYCDISQCIDFEKFINGLQKNRREYVLSISDVLRRKQSILVFKLLEFCLTKFYLINNPIFSENEGVWLLNDYDVKFSLSHSKNYIAVAISDKDVGVDVEKLDGKILKLKNKFDYVSDAENLIKALTLEWTKRESLFKAGFGNNYITECIYDKFFDEYCLTVCTNYSTAEFINIDLNDFIK